MTGAETATFLGIMVLVFSFPWASKKVQGRNVRRNKRRLAETMKRLSDQVSPCEMIRDENEAAIRFEQRLPAWMKLRWSSEESTRHSDVMMKCLAPDYFGSTNHLSSKLIFDTSPKGEFFLRQKELIHYEVVPKKTGRSQRVTDEAIQHHNIHLILKFVEKTEARELQLCFDHAELYQRLKALADAGDPIAFELLFEASQDQEVRQAMIQTAGESTLLAHRLFLALCVDQNPSTIAECALDPVFSDDDRTRAVRELIRLQDERAILTVLEANEAILQIELIQSLKTVEDTKRLQSVLVNLLQREEQLDGPLNNHLLAGKLIVAAAQALGQFGDRAAVLPLRQLQENYPSLLGLNQIHQELDLAIEKIQSRLGDDAKGGLSVSVQEGEAGNISVADEQAGQIAFANADKQKN